MYKDDTILGTNLRIILGHAAVFAIVFLSGVVVYILLNVLIFLKPSPQLAEGKKLA